MPENSKTIALARIQRPNAVQRLAEIRQAMEAALSSSDLAQNYIRKILLDIEFLRENNFAGKPIKGLSSRYRRWKVSDEVEIVYFVETAQELIDILDIHYSGREEIPALSQ
jgi:mRNA-degrading endonuclease RelE of RelBE toxin-antitoxin system